MSWKESGWVLENSPYKGTERVVHLVLSDVCNDGNDFQLWMNQQTIADKAGCSLRTVSSTITSMVKDGYLQKIDDGRGKSHPIYRFLMPGVNTQSTTSNTQSTTDSEGLSYSSNKKNKSASEESENITPQQEMFGTLCEMFKVNPESMTAREKKVYGKTAAELLEVGATRASVKATANRMAKGMGGRQYVTVNSLPLHWSEYCAPDNVTMRAPTYEKPAHDPELLRLAWEAFDVDPEKGWLAPSGSGAEYCGDPGLKGFPRPVV